MTTRIRQTWDLGDGELTLDLSHMRPLRPKAYRVLADVAAALQAHVDELRELMKEATP